VRHRNRERDVSEPLAAHLGLRHLDAAAIADDAAVADALVLTAIALPVLDRAEDLLAEQPVLFRLERAVVDRFGLRHLAVRPAPDHVGRREPNADRVERGPAALFALLRAPEPERRGRQIQRGLQLGFLHHRIPPRESVGPIPLRLPRTALPGTGSAVPSRAR